MNLKIGAILYGVEFVPDLSDDKGKIDGQISYGQAKIRISKSLNEQVQAQTLLHEIIHGIEEHSGRQELKEPVINTLAYGIYQVLRDNPELVKMITKGL
jgi:hypothetical protein